MLTVQKEIAIFIFRFIFISQQVQISTREAQQQQSIKFLVHCTGKRQMVIHQNNHKYKISCLRYTYLKLIFCIPSRKIGLIYHLCDFPF